MDNRCKAIATVHGASGAAVQDAFRRLVDRRAAVDRWSGLRIVGVVAESHGLADRFCSAGYLRRVGTGERFAIFEDHGPGSTVCHLEGRGASAAAAAVERDIAAGCDLVLLSKFGKLEAAGAGLSSAFRMAIGRRIPLITSLSATAMTAWQQLTAGQFTTLPADAAAIDAWIGALCRPLPRPARAGAASLPETLPETLRRTPWRRGRPPT